MPVALIGLGAIPMSLILFYGPNYYDVVGNSEYFGFIIICSALGMISLSFLPLVACYLFLIIRQQNRGFQVWSIATTIIGVVLAVIVEALASGFRSVVVPLVSLAATMFLLGVWIGLRPWIKAGLQVVVAKPYPPIRAAEYVRFDDIH